MTADVVVEHDLRIAPEVGKTFPAPEHWQGELVALKLQTDVMAPSGVREVASYAYKIDHLTG